MGLPLPRLASMAAAMSTGERAIVSDAGISSSVEASANDVMDANMTVEGIQPLAMDRSLLITKQASAPAPTRIMMMFGKVLCPLVKAWP